MKNKGYTLIELLGVVIILALLISFVMPSIIKTIKKSNNTKDELVVDLIYNAAELFIKEQSKHIHKEYGNTYCIKLNTLVEENYVKGKLKLSSNEDDIVNTMSVKVVYTEGFNYEIVNNDECQSIAIDLRSNLTPVLYNGTNWVVADVTEKWYDYNNQEWANAVILNSDINKTVGDIVTVDGNNPDAMAMFVWIPRYEYKIEGEYGKNGTSASLPGEIEINFIPAYQTTPTEGYKIHPAFTFGKEEVSGIWVGKFETSYYLEDN